MKQISTKYLIFRTKYHLLFAVLIWVFMPILAVIMVYWKNAIYYFTALVTLTAFSEYFLLRCPFCRKRPSKPFMRLDDKCQRCGKGFSSLE
jgi:hypothetical protein